VENVEEPGREVFFFPAAQVAETEGTFTNTQRMPQPHFKAADAPGDCRTDVWFTYRPGKRLKKMYADSQAPRDLGFRNLVFDYENEDAREREIGEPDVTKILKELNGYYSDGPAGHVPGFAALADDGSTTCASWIYSGVFPAPDRNLAARKTTRSSRPTPRAEWGLRLEREACTLLTWQEVLEELHRCNGRITDFGRHTAPVFFDSVIGNSRTGERIEIEAFRILRDEGWIATEDQGEIKYYFPYPNGTLSRRCGWRHQERRCGAARVFNDRGSAGGEDTRLWPGRWKEAESLLFRL
jgi:anaerobic selenocysteine-containing dehydrogenase